MRQQLYSVGLVFRKMIVKDRQITKNLQNTDLIKSRRKAYIRFLLFKHRGEHNIKKKKICKEVSEVKNKGNRYKN